MNLTLEDMLLLLHKRTKVTNDDPYLVAELNAGLDESWKRLTVVFPNLQLTFETTSTFGSDTQEFNLSDEIHDLGGEFYESKTFWIKATSGDKYVPVVFMDVNDPRFIQQDQMDAQVLQPVYAAIVNFGTIRFAPTLPSGTYWRADWIGAPPKLSLATNAEPKTSIPSPLHLTCVEYAHAKVMRTLDDTRDSMRDFEQSLLSGIHAIKRRQNQTNNGTGAYPPRQVGVWPMG